ncbi:penicillin-binding protein activator [Glaciecola sp. MH2013]|nr:penicillin-binding protein activator [Glaciecola sp. MH2013]
MSILVVSGCANQQKPIAVNTKPVEVEQTPELILNNAEAAIQRAELEWQANGNIQQRNALLLQAAQDYQSVNECARSNIIIANIEPFLELPFQAQYATLIKAECAILLHYSSGADDKLIQPSIDTMITWLGKISDSRFTNRKEVLIAHLAALHERWDLASTVMAGQLEADSPLNTQVHQNLWRWYLKASKSTQQSLGDSNTVLSGYRALSQIIEDVNLSDADRQQSLRFWLSQNAEHPLALELPQGVANYLNQNIQALEKIAVLLPLSGRVEAQGRAIKEGIMASFFSQLQEIQRSNPSALLPSIDFIDTGSDANTFASDDITQDKLSEYDIIVGPLLREHVAAVNTFELPESMIVYLNRLETPSFQVSESQSDTPTLDSTAPTSTALTSTELTSTELTSTALTSTAPTKAEVFFALAPEDEAKQLANLMMERGVSTPILISNQSALSQRMVDSFNEQWLALNAERNIERPKLVNFTDNKSLRVGITAALDVLQSQRRIRQISNLSSDVVHSVTRNRRDVDAFVVFARPQELELLNPIIESSISLFSERTIPVFASSYSYQHKLNKNTIRDLRNVVFVDMPFLMPTQRESQLATDIDKLWNEPPSSFLRLFAFGFDAFQFSSQIQQLAFFSHTALDGMSGTLTVNADFQVERQLPNATISESSIIEATKAN